MKKLFLGVLLFGLGALTYHYTLANLNRHPGEQAPNRPIATVTRRNISSSVLATGIIKPMVGAEVRVGSRISGIVKRLHTNIGDSVTEGQLLAELDQVELKAVLDQANAALNMAF